MIRVWNNDDYASLETEEYDFYFGYESAVSEEDGGTGEWAFTVNSKKSGERLARIEEPELDRLLAGSRNEPVEYLLCGIGIFIEKLV